MSFYDLSKEERQKLVDKINHAILADIEKGRSSNILNYFSDEDTYIRKTGYLAIGKIYFANERLKKVSSNCSIHFLNRRTKRLDRRPLTVQAK